MHPLVAAGFAFVAVACGASTSDTALTAAAGRIEDGISVAVHLSEITPSDQGDHGRDGMLVLTSVTSLAVNGVSRDARAVVRAIPHTIEMARSHAILAGRWQRAVSLDCRPHAAALHHFTTPSPRKLP